MEITIDVINQKLKTPSNVQALVSGTQEFVKFIFNLQEDWEDLTIFAQFQQDGNAYNQYLDDENSVYLPSEIVAGKCQLIIYGVGGTVRATTNYLTLYIDQNILVADAQSTEISQSLYDQLVGRVEAISESFEQIIGMEDSGELSLGSVEYEVLDARRGDNDIVYDKLGNAIRGQFREMKDTVASTAEFLSEFEDGEFTDDDTVDELISDLREALEETESLQSQIDDLETRFDRASRTGLTLECLGDSFIDRRATGVCWSSQGFAADDEYFYIYRTSHETGHLQKIYRRDTEVNGETVAALTTVAEADINLQHGNDMTVLVIDNVNYLLVVAGNDISNEHQHFGAWLINTNNFSDVHEFTLSIEEDGETHSVFRVGAIKGSDEVYLAHVNTVYKGKVSLSGITLSDPLDISLNVNQGIDYDNGYIYGVDCRARAIEITNIVNGSKQYIKFDYIMQGYILAEAESVAVFGDDIYIVGGTNACEDISMSQTLICHGNFRSQVKQFSMKSNIRNLDEPIALYVGQPEPLKKVVDSVSKIPENGSPYVDYYVEVVQNGTTTYRHYRWESAPEDTYAYTEVVHSETITGISETDNINDDGNYSFAYRNGYASIPFNSVYTAWVAAKSLFLLGLGSDFHIHVNIPIRRHIKLYGGGFNVILTSDIQNIFPAETVDPDSPARLILKGVNGISDISVPTLEVDGGKINCTGYVEEIKTSNNAIVFFNSDREFTAPTSNSLIIGQKKIFSRHGIYSTETATNGNVRNSAKSLYKIFNKVGVVGSSLASGNLSYSWHHCIAQDSNTEWLAIGGATQTIADWLASTNGYGEAQMNASGNKCQLYVVTFGENDIKDILESNSNNISTAIDTFADNYNLVISKIKLLNQGAKILCLTNPLCYYSEEEVDGAATNDANIRLQINNTIRNIVDAKHTPAENADWNILLVDVYSSYYTTFTGKTKDGSSIYSGNILALDREQNEGDFSPVGHRIIADIVEQAISDTVYENSKCFNNVNSVAYDTSNGSESAVS